MRLWSLKHVGANKALWFEELFSCIMGNVGFSLSGAHPTLGTSSWNISVSAASLLSAESFFNLSHVSPPILLKRNH